MPEWYDPASSFAADRRYRFRGDIAFCKVDAPFGETRVELVISNVAGGGHRNTVAGVVAQFGVLHYRATAKLATLVDIEVRRRTLFDRILSRGVKTGNHDFDAHYVAIGEEEDVRRFLAEDILACFVAMWDRAQGLEIDEGEVTLSSSRFSLTPEDLGFIIDTVGTIAAGAQQRKSP